MIKEEDIEAIVEDTLAGYKNLLSEDTYEEMSRLLYITLASHPSARSAIHATVHGQRTDRYASDDVEMLELERDDNKRLHAIIKAAG